MPKAGDIKYCDLLGGRQTNAAFVYMPPSAFWMGDASIEDNHVHLVGVSRGFWIQQTALTEKQYQFLVTKNTSSSLSSKQPKTKISWDDVIKFILNKPLRLPTEAEWELAARAGVGHKYLWAGSNIPDIVAWTSQNSDEGPNDVANLKSNNFGLCDLSGNVDEWCSDWHSILDSTPQLDPQGPALGRYRVYRGSSWQEASKYAWVAFRNSFTPDWRGSDIGVRLIWEI